MASDKTGFHMELFDPLVNGALDASDVRDDTMPGNRGFQIFQVLQIKFYRSTQENVIAVMVSVVLCFAYRVYGIVGQSLCQTFFVLVVCQEMIVRVISPDCLGNGAADQSKTDKSYGFHVRQASFPVTISIKLLYF